MTTVTRLVNNSELSRTELQVQKVTMTTWILTGLGYPLCSKSLEEPTRSPLHRAVLETTATRRNTSPGSTACQTSHIVTCSRLCLKPVSEPSITSDECIWLIWQYLSISRGSYSGFM